MKTKFGRIFIVMLSGAFCVSVSANPCSDDNFNSDKSITKKSVFDCVDKKISDSHDITGNSNNSNTIYIKPTKQENQSKYKSDVTYNGVPAHFVHLRDSAYGANSQCFAADPNSVKLDNGEKSDCNGSFSATPAICGLAFAKDLDQVQGRVSPMALIGCICRDTSKTPQITSFWSYGFSVMNVSRTRTKTFSASSNETISGNVETSDFGKFLYPRLNKSSNVSSGKVVEVGCFFPTLLGKTFAQSGELGGIRHVGGPMEDPGSFRHVCPSIRVTCR